MPTKERVAKAQLAALIAEQAKDAGHPCVFPETITPGSNAIFTELTPSEKGCLALRLVMSRRETAKFLEVKPSCVTRHLKNAFKKLPPRRRQTWKGLYKSLKGQDIFSIPALNTPLAFEDSGEEEPRH